MNIEMGRLIKGMAEQLVDQAKVIVALEQAMNDLEVRIKELESQRNTLRRKDAKAD